jgi:4-hydroxy 2-oxovalerate aldolase
MSDPRHNGIKGSWMAVQPEIKILDCTLRDGGLINSHRFSDDFARIVYDTNVAAGIDYMEMGYKGSEGIFSRDDHGAWRFCTEDDVRRVVGDNDTDLKLSVMADAGRTDYHTDILPCEDSILDMIRVACYVHQLPLALDMVKDAHDKGYETTLNLMAASTVQERDRIGALAAIAASPVDVVYVVDSYGSFYSLQTHDMMLEYTRILEGTGKSVGIHAHNNQALAYANTLEAMFVGAYYLDATLDGLGRGAGNCPIELLVGFLKNPKYDLRPILGCIEKHVLPLRKTMDWGFSVPYMLTGQLNQHPRPAMAMRSGDHPDDYLEFYDALMAEETLP